MHPKDSLTQYQARLNM